jgi:glycosyltransferase involved in cell wall biosynthesis
MIATHRLLRTWSEQVDQYIALTEFSRQRLVEGCLPADRIAVKPNFLSPDPGEGKGSGGFVLFVGRLSPEKGVRTLLSTWRQMRPTLPLKIVGSGPLDRSVAAAVAQMPSIEWLGDQPHGDVLQLMGDAAVLVAPAEWYEPFGLTIIEAFAKGTPVIGADIGSIGGLVANGQNGYLHRAGDPGDLAAKLQAFFDDPVAIPAMRRAARRTYETGYTAEQNYERLMKIYADAIERSSMSSVGGGQPE